MDNSLNIEIFFNHNLSTSERIHYCKFLSQLLINIKEVVAVGYDINNNKTFVKDN